MSEEDKILKVFLDHIERLSNERKSIDDKIAAMELSYELLSGTKRKPALAAKDNPTTMPRRRGPARKALARPPTKRGTEGHTLDKDATAKTLAFIQGRKRPTKPEAVEREFGISRPAATQRLMTLVRLGKAKRVGKGQYLANRADQADA